MFRKQYQPNSFYNSQTMPATVTLKKGKEQSVRRFHPWVFSGAVGSVRGNPNEGDVAEVLAFDGTYLATGHWAPGSIAVRIFSFVKCTPDREFFGSAWQKLCITGSVQA